MNSQPRCLTDNGIESLPRGRLLWIRRLHDLLQNKPNLVNRHGLDCYLFLRLLQTALKCFASMTIMVLPILLPVNYTATKNSIGGLDRFSIANIQNGQDAQCWVTVLVATIVDIHLLRLLLLEFRTVVHLRQSYLHHPSRAKSVTTVLITEIPSHAWERGFLKRVYSSYNGGPVDTILPKEDICNIKEIELNDLLKDHESARLPSSEDHGRQSVAIFGKLIGNTRSEFCLKSRIRKLRKEIKQLKSVAICYFPDLFTAHLVLQARASSLPLKMNAFAIDPDVSSESFIYQGWRTKALRTLSITATLNILAIFWAIPISMTGLLSQLVYLDAFSSSLKRLSDRQLSVIQGLAPQAALSIVMYCFPLIIQLLVKTYPKLEQSKIEVLMQRYYFVFLYVQVFLVVSISSSVTTMIPEILGDVQSVPSILARNLPKACNYFYSYLLLQAVTQCVMVLFQLPDSLWAWLIRSEKSSFPKLAQWSFVYPVFTNLTCICTSPSQFYIRVPTKRDLGIVYSLISPLILPVGTLMFTLFLFVHSYQAIYVLETKKDTAGMLYWEALNHLFVGIYTMNLFLLGLFVLRNALGPAILAFFLIFGVALVQNYVKRNFRPLMRYISASKLSDPCLS